MVATPLGHLRDITLRALDVLRAADRVAAEDTRHTRVLLEAHGIDARLVALHRHNEHAAAAKVLEWLRQGLSVALVSDAGTPAISDPGAWVVRAAREAGFPVSPVPGPSAVVAALSAAGVPGDAFRFEGFLPARREARRERLRALSASDCVVAIHEAPHRVVETVADVVEVMGGGRRITLCRELTKLFEEMHECEAAAAGVWLAADVHRTRGEFVLLVHPAPPAPASARLDEGARVLRLLLEEMPAARAARAAAHITGAPRDALYDLALAAGRDAGDDGQ